MSLRRVFSRPQSAGQAANTYSDSEAHAVRFATPAERVIEQLTADLLDAQRFIAKLQQAQQDSETQIRKLRGLGDYKAAHDRLAKELSQSQKQCQSLAAQLQATHSALNHSQGSTAQTLAQQSAMIEEMRRKARSQDSELSTAHATLASQQAELDRTARRLLEAQAALRAGAAGAAGADAVGAGGRGARRDARPELDALRRSEAEARAAVAAADAALAARDARVERLEAARQRNLTRVVELKAALAAAQAQAAAAGLGAAAADSGESSSSSGPSPSSSASVQATAAAGSVRGKEAAAAPRAGASSSRSVAAPRAREAVPASPLGTRAGTGTQPAALALLATLQEQAAAGEAELLARLREQASELASSRAREAALAAQVEAQAATIRENGELVEEGRQRVLQVLDSLSREGQALESQRAAQAVELEGLRAAHAAAQAELEAQRATNERLAAEAAALRGGAARGGAGRRPPADAGTQTEAGAGEGAAEVGSEAAPVDQDARVARLESDLADSRVRAVSLAAALEGVRGERSALARSLDDVCARAERLAREVERLRGARGEGEDGAALDAGHDDVKAAGVAGGPGEVDVDSAGSDGPAPTTSDAPATPPPSTSARPSWRRSQAGGAAPGTLGHDRSATSPPTSPLPLRSDDSARLALLLEARDAEVRRLLAVIEVLRGEVGGVPLPRAEAVAVRDSLAEKLAEQASSHEALLAAYADLQSRVKALSVELDAAREAAARGAGALAAEATRSAALARDLVRAREDARPVQLMLVHVRETPQEALASSPRELAWLQIECQRLGEENEALAAAAEAMQEELRASAALLRHSNPNQKIQYTQRLKLELEALRKECAAVTRERFTLEQCIRYLAVLAGHTEAAHLSQDATGLQPRVAAAAILPKSLAGEQRFSVGLISARQFQGGTEAPEPLSPRVLARESSDVSDLGLTPRSGTGTAGGERETVEVRILRHISRVCGATKLVTPQPPSEEEEEAGEEGEAAPEAEEEGLVTPTPAMD